MPLVAYDSASASSAGSSPAGSVIPTPQPVRLPSPVPEEPMPEQRVASSSRASVVEPILSAVLPKMEDEVSKELVHTDEEMNLALKKGLVGEAPSQMLKNVNKWKFQAELEFVQGLANPAYLFELADSNMFEDEAFMNYLEYLEYWRDPEYAVFLVYPSCLRYLTLLKSPRFRAAIRYKEGFIAELLSQEEIIWRTWRESDSTKRRREKWESDQLVAAEAAAAEAQLPPPPQPGTQEDANTDEQERPAKKQKGKGKAGGGMSPRAVGGGMSPRGIGGGMSPRTAGGGMSPREGKRVKI